MKLPFLQKDKWPVIRTDEERVVNPSYDAKIQDHLADEFFEAMESSDPVHKREALIALIQHLRSAEDEM